MADQSTVNPDKTTHGFLHNTYKYLKQENESLKGKLVIYEQYKLDSVYLNVKIDELKEKLKEAEVKLIEQDLYFDGKLTQAAYDCQAVRDECKDQHIKLYEMRKVMMSTLRPENVGSFDGIEIATFTTALCKVLNESWLGVKLRDGEWANEEVRLKGTLKRIKHDHIRLALEGLWQTSGRVIMDEKK